jgi:hypothetical protein
MNKSEFRSIFDAWLDESLAREIPPEVVAFIFNLSEPWCIDVVGCGSYDEDDPDWGCDEVWSPASQALDLPESAVGGDWESVLESCKGMIADYLERECAGSAVLKRSMAVAVGFVDGEAELVWER